MKVVVTGASSAFAQALLPALCKAAAIEAVTGIDARPLRSAHPKLSAAALDASDSAVAGILPGHEALVHLVSCAAFKPEASVDGAEPSVRGAHKLFHAARAAGLRRLIHVSSASVYGPAVHANEQAALRPLAGFAYAEQQAHLEQLLAIDFRECVRLRPHVVVGPNAHKHVKALLRQPFYPRLSDPQPLFQCVHEDDLAAAVLLCLQSDARGAYNIASEDSISLRDAIRARHRLSIGLPESVARSGLRLASRVLGRGLDPIWLERVSHTLLINCRRAAIDLGWRASYSAREAIAATT
jgi:UDP-glucose 4-epimerase